MIFIEMLFVKIFICELERIWIEFYLKGYYLRICSLDLEIFDSIYWNENIEIMVYSIFGS